jgi:hypothetical protein
MLVFAQDMMPAHPYSALVVHQQKIFLIIKVNIGPFKATICEDASLDNMPNLILVKGHADPLPILHTIFETKRKKLPICDHTLLGYTFLVAFAALSEHIPI